MKPRHILVALIGWWVLLFHNWRLALIVLVAVCLIVIGVCLIFRLMNDLDEHYATVPKNEPAEDFRRWEEEMKPVWDPEIWGALE